MKALIDADMLEYQVAFASQWVDDDGELQIAHFDQVAERMDNLITEICEAVGATSHVLYLTGKGNFREAIAKRQVYKGTRKTDKPFHYANMRAYLKFSHNAVVIEGMEADDAMVIEQMSCAREHGVRFPVANGYGILDYGDWLLHKDTTWHVNSKGYLCNDTGKGDTRKVIDLHRLILKGDKGTVTDHINGNKLDNRKVNLRVCTVKENVRNSKAQKGTSKFKGVHWDTARGKWAATIKVDRQRLHLGRFDSELEAAGVYDVAAIEHFGEFARGNFIKCNVPVFKETVICSRDKDLRICPFNHYSWECYNQPEKPMYWVDELGEFNPKYKQKVSKKTGNETTVFHKLEATGLRMFYAQLLMGDTVDSIPGLPGCGAKGAYDALQGCLSEIEMYEVCLSMYSDKYLDEALESFSEWALEDGTLIGRSAHDIDEIRDEYCANYIEDELIEQARLLWMVNELHEDGSPVMWEVPSETSVL